MSFYENAKRAISDAGKTVVEKSNDLLENGKIKYEVYSLETEVKQIYEKMGQEIYNAYKNDLNISDLISDNCNLIDEKNAKIAELKQKAEKDI